MIGTLAAESLALATGIFPKRAPSEADVRRAVKMHGRIEAALKWFLNNDAAEPYEWEMPPPQDELHSDVLTPLEGDKWDAHHLDPATLGQWLIIVNRARQYIADKWPIYPSDGLALANYELGDSELDDVWELTRSLDGLDGITSDLKSHALAPEQVAAFAACYPDFYEVTIGGANSPPGASTPILFELMTELGDGLHELTSDHEDMLRVLQQLPDQAPIITSPSPSPQSKKPVTASVQKLAQSSQTHSEVLETKQQQGK